MCADFFFSLSLRNADQQISLTLQRRLIEAFEDFSKDILKACSYEPAAASIPVTVNRFSKVFFCFL